MKILGLLIFLFYYDIAYGCSRCVRDLDIQETVNAADLVIVGEYIADKTKEIKKYVSTDGKIAADQTMISMLDALKDSQVNVPEKVVARHTIMVVKVLKIIKGSTIGDTIDVSGPWQEDLIDYAPCDDFLYIEERNKPTLLLLSRASDGVYHGVGCASQSAIPIKNGKVEIHKTSADINITLESMSLEGFIQKYAGNPAK